MVLGHKEHRTLAINARRKLRTSQLGITATYEPGI
jgi:hypothetical protein